MKEVHPSKIKIGDYYIQERMGDFKLLKRRIEKGREDELWGVYIKILLEKYSKTFMIGDCGFTPYRDLINGDIKVYLLTENEAIAYMI